MILFVGKMVLPYIALLGDQGRTTVRAIVRLIAMGFVNMNAIVVIVTGKKHCYSSSK
jgi:hypothetical protein